MYIETQSTTTIPSRNNDTIYLQSGSGFKPYSRSHLNINNGDLNGTAANFSSSPSNTLRPVNVAVFIQKCSRYAGICCEGLLAGIALAHIILVSRDSKYR